MEDSTKIQGNLYYDERSAGGIVYKIEKDKVLWLLIKVLRKKTKEGFNKDRLQVVYKFPKGHLKDEEVLKQAALREVEEEGKIKSEIVSKIGSNDYIIWDKIQRKKIIKKVTFFLMKYVDDSTLRYYDTEVVLERVWLDYKEATHRLAYDSEKVLLRKARERLDEIIKR
jgi:ADP-ribose pyrophosphatase YjhB (NUDIX family)